MTERPYRFGATDPTDPGIETSGTFAGIDEALVRTFNQATRAILRRDELRIVLDEERDGATVVLAVLVTNPDPGVLAALGLTENGEPGGC